MSSKISQLANAAALTGAEQLPAVQAGGNVKLTPLQLANFVGSNPAGFAGFAAVAFASGPKLAPTSAHSFALQTNAPQSEMQFTDNAGTIKQLLGWRNAGVYIATGTFLATLAGGDLSLENYGQLLWNYSPVLDVSGNILDNEGIVLLNRLAGRQPDIPNATDGTDVVARVNDILMALRVLGLIVGGE